MKKNKGGGFSAQNAQKLQNLFKLVQKSDEVCLSLRVTNINLNFNVKSVAPL